MSENTQIKGSRTFPVAVLLTLAGGYLDAYTYSSRGGVFANAQTGNIVKFGIALANSNFTRCLQLLVPITAFVIGILAALVIETYFLKKEIHFIRRMVLIMEMTVMVISALLPQSEIGNMLANTMISFVCAMQMEAFKTFAGQPFATTVSTGNLRKFIEFLYQGCVEHDNGKLKIALMYLTIVIIFITGALIGTLITDAYGLHSVAVPAVLLGICFVIITWKRIASLNMEK